MSIAVVAPNGTRAIYASQEEVNEAWKRSLKKAMIEVNEVVKDAGTGIWHVTSWQNPTPYEVHETKPGQPFMVRCTCLAAQHGSCCKHAAAVAYCLRQNYRRMHRATPQTRWTAVPTGR